MGAHAGAAAWAPADSFLQLGVSAHEDGGGGVLKPLNFMTQPWFWVALFCVISQKVRARLARGAPPLACSSTVSSTVSSTASDRAASSGGVGNVVWLSGPVLGFGLGHYHLP